MKDKGSANDGKYVVQNKKIKKNYVSHFSYKETSEICIKQGSYQIKPRACSCFHLTSGNSIVHNLNSFSHALVKTEEITILTFFPQPCHPQVILVG